MPKRLLTWMQLENLQSPLLSAGELLGSFDPQDRVLEVNRDKTLEFLRLDPEPFTRANPKGHLTASAVVVDPGSRRSLMVFHPFFKRWQQPGGHTDGDSDLVRVALREAVEETGISELLICPEIIDIGVGRGEGEVDHIHFDVRFVVIAPSGTTDVSSPEGLPLRWFAVNHEGDELDVVRRRMVKSAFALIEDSW